MLVFIMSLSNWSARILFLSTKPPSLKVRIYVYIYMYILMLRLQCSREYIVQLTLIKHTHLRLQPISTTTAYKPNRHRTRYCVPLLHTTSCSIYICFEFYVYSTYTQMCSPCFFLRQLHWFCQIIKQFSTSTSNKWGMKNEEKRLLGIHVLNGGMAE